MPERQNFIYHDDSHKDPDVSLPAKFSQQEYDENRELKDVKITQEHVCDYVQNILNTYKKMVNENQEDVGLAFVIESFMPEKLFSNFSAGRIDYLNAISDIAVARIRTAVLDEIGRQIELNEDFKDLNKNDIFLGILRERSANIVYKMVNARKEHHYLKQMELKQTTKEGASFSETMSRDRMKFFDIVGNDLELGIVPPNIVLPERIGDNGQRFLTKGKKMVILEDFLFTIHNGGSIKKNKPEDSEKTEQKIEAIIKVIIKSIEGFAKGLVYIKEKGFTLMDIDTLNIAYDLENKQGVVFDLDGIIKPGIKTVIRLNRPFSFEKFPIYTDGEILSNEMTFQLGVALERSVSVLDEFLLDVDNDKIKNLVNKLRFLAISMIRPKQKNNGKIIETHEVFGEQPTLETCIEHLKIIYGELENATV